MVGRNEEEISHSGGSGDENDDLFSQFSDDLQRGIGDMILDQIEEYNNDLFREYLRSNFEDYFNENFDPNLITNPALFQGLIVLPHLNEPEEEPESTYPAGHNPQPSHWVNKNDASRNEGANLEPESEPQDNNISG